MLSSTDLMDEDHHHTTLDSSSTTHIEAIHSSLNGLPIISTLKTTNQHQGSISPSSILYNVNNNPSLPSSSCYEDLGLQEDQSTIHSSLLHEEIFLLKKKYGLLLEKLFVLESENIKLKSHINITLTSSSSPTIREQLDSKYTEDEEPSFPCSRTVPNYHHHHTKHQDQSENIDIESITISRKRSRQFQSAESDANDDDDGDGEDDESASSQEEDGIDSSVHDTQESPAELTPSVKPQQFSSETGETYSAEIPSAVLNGDIKILAWTDVVRLKYPYFMGSTPAMSNLVKSFLKENKLSETRVTPLSFTSTARPTLGIPTRLYDAFIKMFEVRFVGSDGAIERRKGSSIPSSLPSMTTNIPLWKTPDHRITVSNKGKRQFPTPTPRSTLDNNNQLASSTASKGIGGRQNKGKQETSYKGIGGRHKSKQETSDNDEEMGEETKKNPSITLFSTSPGEITLWSDVVRPLYNDYLQEHQKNTLMLSRIRNGIREFLSSTVENLGMTPEDCLMTPIKGRGRKTFGIPTELHDEFIEWFGKHMVNHFKIYPEGSAMHQQLIDRAADREARGIHPSGEQRIRVSSLNGTLPHIEDAMIQKRRKCSTHKIAGGSLTIKDEREDYTHPIMKNSDDSERLQSFAHAQVLYSQSVDNYPTVPVAADSESNLSLSSEVYYIDENSLIRYNAILKQIMPNYGTTATKEEKIQVKRSVKNFLIKNLGPEEISQCLMWADGGQFHTYGIPPFLDVKFRNWATAELQHKFSS